MPIYQTTFDVNASAESVWRVLTTLDQYGEWNPQIPRASGAMEEQGQIRLRLALPGRPAMNLVATVEKLQPRQLLTWRGHVVAPWLFEGHRTFEIHPADEGRVSVTHVEDVHGLLAPLFAVFMGGLLSTVTTRSTTRCEHALRVGGQTLPSPKAHHEAAQQRRMQPAARG